MINVYESLKLHEKHLQNLSYREIRDNLGRTPTDEEKIKLLSWLLSKLKPQYSKVIDKASKNDTMLETLQRILKTEEFSSTFIKDLFFRGLDSSVRKQRYIYSTIYCELSLYASGAEKNKKLYVFSDAFEHANSNLSNVLKARESKPEPVNQHANSKKATAETENGKKTSYGYRKLNNSKKTETGESNKTEITKFGKTETKRSHKPFKFKSAFHEETRSKLLDMVNGKAEYSDFIKVSGKPVSLEDNRDRSLHLKNNTANISIDDTTDFEEIDTYESWQRQRIISTKNEAAATTDCSSFPKDVKSSELPTDSTRRIKLVRSVSLNKKITLEDKEREAGKLQEICKRKKQD